MGKPQQHNCKNMQNGSSKQTSEHNYSVRSTRQTASPDLPSRNSDSEEMEPFICSVCKKAIYTPDPPVECDFCDNSYCFKCSEISSKAQYKKLCLNVKEEEGTLWFCKHCRTSVPGVKKMVVRVTKIEETQSNILERLDNLEKSNEGLDEKIKGAIQEQKEVDGRRLNIMCFGLAEENPFLRGAEETAKLKHVIKDILEISEEDFPLQDVKPIRIGQYNEGKVRPVKFQAQTFESKKKLLQMARSKLKDSADPDCRKLFFKPDLTKKQRAEGKSKRMARRVVNPRENEQEMIDEGAEGGGPFHGSQSQK